MLTKIKRIAILTFDYEVFLGPRTGTIENCVINPTDQILKVLKKNKAKSIFFVDATWLYFLKNNLHKDYIRIVKQIREIISSGSSVELHLHPHWINAKVAGENIDFQSYKNYKLHSLKDEEITDLFIKSTELLESITDQNVKCFRAGGFCIYPFSKIKNAFIRSGIKFDFSVAPGFYLLDDEVYDVDFSKIPRLTLYNFQDDITKPEVNGQFVEIPLSTYKNNPIYRLINKFILKMKRDKISGDGTSINEKSQSFIMSLRRRLKPSYNILSTDKTSSIFFKLLLLTQFKWSKLVVIMSHSKLISDEALSNIEYIAQHYSTLNSSDLETELLTKSTISNNRE